MATNIGCNKYNCGSRLGTETMKTETKLSLLYFVAAATALSSTICMAVAWIYWQKSLNMCFDYNCGCLLNMRSSYNMLIGGTVHTCRYLTLCPIPVTIWSVVMCGYHAYRVFMPKKHKAVASNLRTLSSQRKTLSSPPMYALLTVVAIIFTILGLSCGILMVHGYHASCFEYRKSVIEQIKASGSLADMISNRLSCQSVYDFMDYMQPGSRIIQTGLTLQLALAAIWINFIVYFALSLYNGTLYIKERKLRLNRIPPRPAPRQRKRPNDMELGVVKS